MSEVEKELKAIKQLLILQLLHNKVPVRQVVKAAGISNTTLYKFLPKDYLKNVKKGDEAD